MTTTTDLSTLTPVEIDTLLADAWGRVHSLDAKAESKERYADNYVKHGHADRAAHLREEAAAHQVEASKIHSNEIAPLNNEFNHRGGWARAFLVNNSNGHVHSNMVCSTCYPTTQYVWMVEYSAKSQEEIIEAAGERACTVCYPDAPVDAKGTKMYTPDEIEKQQARLDREAKRAEKDAAKVVVTWTEESNGRVKEREFKTLRGLTNELSSIISSLVWYGETHPYASAWVANLVEGGKVAKAQGWDYDKAVAAQRKKATREGGTPKF